MVSYLWDNFFKRENQDADIVGILTENFVFKALNPIELHFVKRLVHFRRYKPGEVIFTQGELGVGMYIVATGTVNITVEDLHSPDQNLKNHFVTRLSKGDFFGEISLVEQAGRRTATAVAADNVTLLGFFKPDLSEVIERNPKVGVKILHRLGEVLARRLKETADRFTELKREMKDLTDNNGAQ